MGPFATGIAVGVALIVVVLGALVYAALRILGAAMDDADRLAESGRQPEVVYFAKESSRHGEA